MVEHENKKLEESRKTILTVDDSVTVRELLGKTFEKLGYSTITARDGLEALEICETIHIDLIFLDIEMPRMNGLEFLKRKQDLEQDLDIEIPTVMLTSRGAGKMRRIAAELGAIAYLVKPYTEKNISDCIHQCLYSNLNPTDRRLRQLEFVNNSLKEENTSLKKKLELSSTIDIDKYEAILGSAIHSLKNEFLFVSTAKDEILEIAGTNSEIEEECENIKRSINYSQAIVKRLLGFLEMNTFKFQMVDITSLLNEIELMVKPRLPSFIDLEFKIDSHVDDCQISTDAEQLKMVLLELIENSKKSFSGISSGSIKVEAVQKENEILIFVKDNGAGIPNEVKNKLFTEKVVSNKGTGLGLFLCSKVIQELNGKLAFIDVDEPGSEFLISLPYDYK